MGQQKVKVIFKKVKSSDEKGYIRLSIRENGKTHIKNLPLKPISEIYWKIEISDYLVFKIKYC